MAIFANNSIYPQKVKNLYMWVLNMDRTKILSLKCHEDFTYRVHTCTKYIYTTCQYSLNTMSIIY